MSPLLNTRPSVSVTRKLLAACVVTAALAAIVALGSGSGAAGQPTGAAPAFFAVGAVCAALVAYMLFASARTLDDRRLRWMAAGAAIACLGLIANLLGQPTLFTDLGPLSTGSDASAARY